jgi:hypothetical protein
MSLEPRFILEALPTMNTALKTNLTLFSFTIAMLAAPVLRAQTFEVNLNTSALSAADAANAPFFLDFQLNYGSAPESANTVTLSNFQFVGGGALGSVTTNGDASGSLGSSVSLTASSASQFNELFQEFASSTTDIEFTATVTENGSNGVTPTEFSTAILDSSLGSPAQLFTTAPDTASLVTLDLASADTLKNVNAFTSVSSADGNTPVSGVSATITAIPEPSTTAAILGGAALILAVYARRSGKLGIA